MALLLEAATMNQTSSAALTKTLAEIEREAIRQRLEQFHGDTALTAKSLGVSRNKIYLFLQIECARKQSS